MLYSSFHPAEEFSPGRERISECKQNVTCLGKGNFGRFLKVNLGFVQHVNIAVVGASPTDLAKDLLDLLSYPEVVQRAALKLQPF